ncbi:MAG: Beta-galactosidase [Planctomycetes bacterium ADurb.Bin126]|nr:MAG: Beta-galactosidase [Planctomycetes bacterium ADurb.Bin126]HOD80152.1 glycoside hydrolase family 2 TIM barrel-domain containing protein [Phycisphaerae bacterium]HQL71625.1 glycoside hydrolase family 2 TIM barrel-domain containing protein [Phycisphaerae bacterium]
MRAPHLLLVTVLAAIALGPVSSFAAGPAACTETVCLDGQWKLAADPSDAGKREQWMLKVHPTARDAKVPWIIQDAWPDYHGLAWYWRTFDAPPNPHAGGRYVLRFWAVDYAADVWLNGKPLGRHEGGESAFEFDATEAVKPAGNLLAVRVLNPTHTPIDGIVLNQTPHRNKALPYGAGSAWDQGGIMDSVELLICPPVRTADLFARGDWKSGEVRIRLEVHGDLDKPAPARVEFSVATAREGGTVALSRTQQEIKPGRTVVEQTLRVPQHRLWELNDPQLYRVTARVQADGSESFDERSVRIGFRDFRFADGYFRLNGRRIYLRCSHTGNCCPAGLEMPHDPDLLRRDLLNVKAMRFNAIRFISGIAKRYQLDLCDEIGLMVYEESYAGWCLADSPQMGQRYDESVLGMVLRDRNHACLTIWGLLNETSDGAVFRHAAALLPALRELDDTRMVILNSGRWDNAHQQQGIPGIDAWHPAERIDPCVTRNSTDHVIQGLGITWQPKQLALHPGVGGEYGALRWTAPRAGQVELKAVFASIAKAATTDVHVLHNGKAVFESAINVGGKGASASCQATLAVQAGDTLDFAVGWGNGNYGADTTALAATIRLGDKTFDPAAEFSAKVNPNGPWTCGQLASGPRPDSKTFAPFPTTRKPSQVGTFANPGQARWDNGFDDRHPYQRVPHTEFIIRTLRTIAGSGDGPLFLSEYGVGSAVDLVRVGRLYEQIGKAGADDARFYAVQRDRFLADWKAWRLDECFDRPEDFFRQSLTKMASQRLLGTNAIRANPNVIGYSLTGTVDQGMTGEGLTTTFREFKPGTVDAMFEALAPLRWCLFAEPLNVYRGAKVRLEAVLANEDALAPGEYPVRVQVVGPGPTRVLEERALVKIPKPGAAELPLAMPVWAKEVAVDGPPGAYRLLVTFEKGAAATGGQTDFFVADPPAGPAPTDEVVLWGDDPLLRKWLTGRGVRVRGLDEKSSPAGEVILAGLKPPQPAGPAFEQLRRRIERGATAIFPCPEVFRQDKDPMAYLPLEHKGTLAHMASWVYLKDEWAKRHPIFDGLPCGGVLDLAFYREIIPDHVLAGQNPPAQAVAGAINASQAYSSGLLVAVHSLGSGRIVLNTLRVRDNLGAHPAADRLLANMIRWAGAAPK